MSQYSTGSYDATSGQSFEDLAPVMQATMAAQGINKRQYTTLALFQHYYQKHSSRSVARGEQERNTSTNRRGRVAANNLGGASRGAIQGAAPRVYPKPRFPRARTETVARTPEARSYVLAYRQPAGGKSGNSFMPFDEDVMIPGNSMPQNSSSSSQRGTKRSLDDRQEIFQPDPRSSTKNSTAKRRKVVSGDEDEDEKVDNDYDGAFALPLPNSSSRPFIPFDVPLPSQAPLHRPLRIQYEDFQQRDDEPLRRSRARKTREKPRASPETFDKIPTTHENCFWHNYEQHERSDSAILIPPTHEQRFEYLHGTIQNVGTPKQDMNSEVDRRSLQPESYLSTIKNHLRQISMEEEKEGEGLFVLQDSARAMNGAANQQTGASDPEERHLKEKSVIFKDQNEKEDLKQDKRIEYDPRKHPLTDLLRKTGLVKKKGQEKVNISAASASRSRPTKQASPPAPLISHGQRNQSGSEARSTGRSVPYRSFHPSKSGPNMKYDIPVESSSPAPPSISPFIKDEFEKHFDNELRYEPFHPLSKPTHSNTLPLPFLGRRVSNSKLAPVFNHDQNDDELSFNDGLYDEATPSSHQTHLKEMKTKERVVRFEDSYQEDELKEEKAAQL